MNFRKFVGLFYLKVRLVMEDQKVFPIFLSLSLLVFDPGILTILRGVPPFIAVDLSCQRSQYL